MRLLILGASGVIGSSIVRASTRAGWEVHAQHRDSRCPVRLSDTYGFTSHSLDADCVKNLVALINKTRPDAIVHAAFPASGLGTDAETRSTLLHTGLGLILKLTEALRVTGFNGNLVTLGSILSYGANRDSAQMQPDTFRGVIKAAESLLCRQFEKETGCNVTELRIATVYGPWEQPNRLIPSLFRAALTNNPISLTSEATVRDWVYIEDVANACLTAAARPTRLSSSTDICTGKLTCVHDIAHMVETITGHSLIKDFAFARTEHYSKLEISSKNTNKENAIGWAPDFNLQTGLTATWTWARSQKGQEFLCA